MREFTGRSAEPLITLEAILAFAESTREQRDAQQVRVQAVAAKKPRSLSPRAAALRDDLRERKALAEAERRRVAATTAASIRKHLAQLEITDEVGFKRVRNCAEALLENLRVDVFDPHGFCVYLLWSDDTERPIYVGQSINVMGRVGSHMTSDKGPLTRRVQIVRCTSREQMCALEASLIELYQPPMNTAGR
jgi:hypothetical protein